MRKPLALLLLLGVVLGLVGFAEPDPLIGEWVQEDERGGIVQIFHADGRFNEVLRQGQVVSRRSGRWSREGNRIKHTEMKNDQNGGRVADYTDTIVELNGDTLKLQFAPRVVYTFTRKR